MDNAAYLDFLSSYSVFNIGRNHPVVKQAIRDVLDLDLPNMVQWIAALRLLAANNVPHRI
jgi:4-aminobutyrate aminotransferase-like enzyme